MINSIYDVLFGHLIAGKCVEIPREQFNDQSLRVQWSKFRKENAMLQIIQNLVICTEEDHAKQVTIVSLRPTKRRKNIPYTIVEPANASTLIPNDLESDQTCEGGATSET